MTTHIHLSLTKIEERWKEADRISSIAKRNKRKQNHAILNGTAIVLQTAHFEATLKEICEAFIKDLNTHKSTKLISDTSKYFYIDYLLSDIDDATKPQDRLAKMRSLSDWIFSNELILDSSFFIDTEANPKPSVVKKLAKQLGVRDFFKIVSTTRIEYWLATNEAADFNGEIIRLKRCLKSSTNKFPYTVSLDEVTINENRQVNDEQECALYNNLNTALKYRNAVAHNGVMEEEISQDDVVKTQITLRAITLYFIASICTNLQNGSYIAYPT